ncbi:universal stress protein [Saccharopolyspora spinosa]|uniref:universal stress protein n=1 Tax=Saccharopolyspora spinosa TaxID=60894 RepID=UPI000237ADA5
MGVDGSEDSVRAAAWAVAEVGHRSAPLRLVIVNDDPARADYAEKAVQKAAAKCRAQAPHLNIDAEAVSGHPVEELLRRSAEAQLVVLGKRGQGGFTDALLGGVSSAVATHASCPVVVVRKGVPTTVGPVVAGVDGSESSLAALRFAFEEAAGRAAELVVMQVWREEGLLAVPLPPFDRAKVQREIERALAEQTAFLREEFPKVRTREVAQRGHPVSALADAGRDAQLLVVGHRGRGGFDGLYLGSVAAGVLHHAPCPVAVVRSAEAAVS